MTLRLWFFTCSLFLFSTNCIRADAWFIPYEIEVSDEFLGDRDSATMVLQHGQYLLRFKLKRGVKTILKRQHYLPCRSGLNTNFESPQGQALLQRYNGAYYNFFVVGTNEVITVRSIAYDDMTGRGIQRGRTYFVDLVTDVMPTQALRKSLEMYQEHTRRIALFADGRLSVLLKNNLCVQHFKSALRELRVKGFTASELNQQFSLGLSDNGIRIIEYYQHGRVVGSVRFVTEAGYVKRMSDP